MTVLRLVRSAGLVLLLSTLLGFAAAPAQADLQECIDAGNAQGIDTPTCEVNADGTMTPIDSSDGLGTGIPAAFVVVFVLVLAVGIGGTIWRVSTARRLATDAGLDPDVATGVALLDENGLSATYIASSLRPGSTPQPAGAGSADQRLTELASLRDRGLITQAEYDEKRRSIIDSV